MKLESLKIKNFGSIVGEKEFNLKKVNYFLNEDSETIVEASKIAIGNLFLNNLFDEISAPLYTFKDTNLTIPNKEEKASILSCISSSVNNEEVNVISAVYSNLEQSFLFGESVLNEIFSKSEEKVYPVIYAYNFKNALIFDPSLEEAEENQNSLNEKDLYLNSAISWFAKCDKGSLAFTIFWGIMNRTFPYISDIDVINNSIFITDKFGEQISYTQMKRDYKLFCLIFKIAYICLALNGYLNTYTFEKTPGILILKGVHEKRYISLLESIFPKIQIIATC